MQESTTLTYKSASTHNGYRISNNFAKTSDNKILHTDVATSYKNNSNTCKMPHPNK